MPTAADYAATASSVYDPQAAAEDATASQGLAAANASADSATRSEQASFANTQDTLATAHQSNNQNNDFQYTNALGGNSSGLQANTNNIEGNNYLKALTTATTQDSNQMADIADSRTLAANNYSSTLSAITSKYAGLKSGYVADQLSNDSSEAFQEKMAQEAQANATQNAEITASSYNQPAAKPTTAQELASVFSGYQPASQGGKAFFTERSAAPQIAADLGISYQDALNMAYAYRKQTFNE